MNINPIVLFYIVLSLVLSSSALVTLLISYFYVLKKQSLLQKENDSLKHKEEKDTAKILEKARQKANNIIANANILDEDLKKAFKLKLSAVSLDRTKLFDKEAANFFEEYKKELDDLKLKTIKIIRNVSKDIEKNTSLEFEDYKNILKQETFDSQKILEERIEQKYSSIEKEVEDYKNDRLKKVDDEIYTIISRVSALILGKAISPQDHEQLILQALDKAKQEKALDR